MWVCPRCEQSNRDEDDYCTLCGTAKEASADTLSGETASGDALPGATDGKDGAWSNVGDWHSAKPGSKPEKRKKAAADPVKRTIAAQSETDESTAEPPTRTYASASEVVAYRQRLKLLRVWIWTTSVALFGGLFWQVGELFVSDITAVSLAGCYLFPCLMIADLNRPQLRKKERIAGPIVAILGAIITAVACGLLYVFATDFVISAVIIALLFVRWFCHRRALQTAEWLAANSGDPRIK